MQEISKLIGVFIFYVFIFQVHSTCLKRTYGNGIGIVPSACGDSDEKNGALCYPKCKDGYSGAGPVCWSNCPSGYSDTGAFCQLWPHIYGKGCCCTIFTKSCCGNCQSGYSDDGCTCRKNGNTIAKSSYGRGAGTILICPTGYVNDASLCYKACRSGYDLVGPLCWQQCKSPNPHDCSEACTTSSSDCIARGFTADGFKNIGVNSCDE